MPFGSRRRVSPKVVTIIVAFVVLAAMGGVYLSLREEIAFRRDFDRLTTPETRYLELEVTARTDPEYETSEELKTIEGLLFVNEVLARRVL